MSNSGKPSQAKRHYRRMKVANIRERKGADYAEVVFLESARFYRLPRETPSFDEILMKLRDALAKGRALEVWLASPESEIIEQIQEINADPERL